MVKRKTDIWLYFEVLPAGSSNQKTINVRCKFCKSVHAKNATRMKSHLQQCTYVPHMIKLKFNILTPKSKGNHSKFPFETSMKKITSAKLDNDNTDAACTSSTVSTASTSASDNIHVETPVCTKINRIQSFCDRMTHEQNNELNILLARAIYTSSAPHSITENEDWKLFFKKIRPSYTLPSRYMLSNRLLTEEYERVEVQVNDKIKQADNLSLQCDGWSNLRNESVINFIVTTPEPLFVKSVLTKAEKHTAEYITKLMVEVLEEYGPKKFFAIVTDNAKNMRKAVRQCEEMYPHLVSYGCLAHTLHLLCSDILKLSSIETHLSHIIHIVKTINQCQVLRAQFTEIRNEMKCGVSLSLPVKTRWGSHVKCLQDLTKCKSVLQRLAISPDKTIQDRIRSAKANLLDEGFWINSSALVELLKPITEAITRLEGDSSSIHLVCETFAKIGSNISTHLECVKLTDCEKTEAMDKFISRKEYALQPIHFAADLLNPRSVGANLSSAERIEAMKYITTMSTTTTIEIGDEGVSKITEDLGNYLAKTDFFGETFLWNILDNVSLVTWWKGFCGHSCLSKVAVRILTMPCTSAATERSFSSQSSIHTKRRNRLTTQRAANLNYIQYNSKLLKRSRQHHIQSQYPIEETVQNNVSIEGRNLQKEIEVIENHISEEEELDETISSWHSNTTGNGNSDDDFNFADFAMTDDEIDQRMETREQRPARILRQSKVNILENVLMKSGKGTEQPQKKTEVEKDTSDAENKDAVLDLPEIKKITQGSLEEQTIETSTFYNKKVSSCLRKRKL